MNKIAIKMLIEDRAKYLGMIFGIVFATLLMAQQMSLFIGIMNRTFGIIGEMREVDIWVMDKKVKYFDGVDPMPDIVLSKVRGVEGVKWAMPIHKSNVTIKVNNELQMVSLIGVDDVTMIGIPNRMIVGSVENLKIPNSVIVEQLGYRYILPDQNYEIGQEFEANDIRMKLVGIVNATPNFSSPILFYSSYSNAIKYSGSSRNKMSFVVVKTKDGYSKDDVVRSINENTNFKAITSENFKKETRSYYLTHTGIAINFGITVLLGFIVGSVIVGQTFYMFVVDNLKQFAVIKAIGVTNRKILQMVLVQASIVGAIGYSIGIGLTSIFFAKVSGDGVFKGFELPWQVAFLTFIAIVFILIITSFISVRKALIVDPAIVFKG